MESTIKIKGIIFDLDGVLVFTDRFHYLAWKAIANQLGVYFDEKINCRLRGVSRMRSLEILLERYEGEPLSSACIQKLAEEKNEIYREFLKTMTPADVSADVRETLFRLREMGYLLAVGSSSKNAGMILEQVQLREMLDGVSDGNNISRSKPDPEVFVKAAQMLGLTPEECLVVEDAAAGIEAAKACGMYAAGMGEKESLGKADFFLKNISELVEW